MKKLAVLSTKLFFIMLIAGCGISSNDRQEAQQGVSITATQPTAWEGSEDYLEFVIDLGSPNETSENIIVYFKASGSGLERDDIDGMASLEQEYVEVPPGSQTATIKLEGFTSDGSVTETQPIRISLTGCSSADYPLGPSSEATAIIMDGDGPTVTDIDGNVYHTVLIGTQTWMVENLKTSRFRNGEVVSGSWYYENDYNNKNIYGSLYNWSAVSDPRGLAPAGWHIPSRDEWYLLSDYLGREVAAGGKMKATRLWNSPNEGATNESGFTALPGGMRTMFCSFDKIVYYGYWWSSTEESYLPTDAFGCILRYDGGWINWMNISKEYGCSVRCIKD